MAGAVDLPSRWDDLVDDSGDLDRFCSGSAWTMAAHEAFASGRRGRLLVAEGTGAAVALACARTPWHSPLLSSLEALWGFACPVVGPDVDEGAHLVHDLLQRRAGRWEAALLTGFVAGSAREGALVERIGRRYRVEPGPTMTRRVADLGDGAEAWLARRGPHFRRNLRRAGRRAEEAGLDIELLRGGRELVTRAVRVDRRSWKGRQGSGLTEPAMARFYGLLAHRLAPQGGFRAGFARFEGRDVGYILGGVRGGTYRGFQLAHDEDAADLSVGNLLQWAQIRAATDEGVRRYDLGMDMDYKRAWSDREVTTRTLVVIG